MIIHSIARPGLLAPRTLRAVNAMEAVTWFGLLLLYIWYGQAHMRSSWMVLLGLLIASEIVHGESPQSLGVRWHGFVDCTRRYALPVLAFVAAVVIIGLTLRTIRPVRPARVVEVLVGYTWWALLQQYLLNGFFVNRLSAAFDERHQYVVAPLAGILFAAAHTPNAFLMDVTLVFGTLAAIAYRRHRNLLFLALAHTVVGTALWLAVPDSLSNHLRVGPGAWR